MIRIENLTKNQYSQLRDAALATVDYTLGAFCALEYDWLDSSEKNDIVSDAVLKALQTFKPDGGSSFTGWLKMISRQLTISRLTGHRNTCSIVFTTEEEDELEIPELSTTASAEDEVIGRELEHQVQSVLAIRSDLDRKIFDLYTRGYQPREIAAMFGLTPNAVSIRINKMKNAVEYAMAG